MSDRISRYAGAVGLTAIGIGIAFVLQRQLEISDGLIFAAVVAVCARYLGTGPSLFASALAVLAIDVMMLPPIGRVEFTHPETLAYLSVFVALAVIISGMTHSLRIARAQAEGLANRTKRLLDVTTALAEAELPRDVARVVMREGLEVVEASTGLIGVIAGRGGDCQVLDWRPVPAAENDPLPRIEQLGDGPVGEVLRRREPVVIASSEELRTRFPAAYERLEGDPRIQALKVLPLMHGDRLIGALSLGFSNSKAFGAVDPTFPQLFAQSVANALARALTFEQERAGRREAETLARTREEVLGVVAHDLRNPLGVAGGVLKMLEELELEPADREKLLATGTRAVNQMNRLIGDLLDAMRIEAGRLALEIEEITAASVLSQAEESVRHLAKDKDITLTVEEPDPSLLFRADRGRIVQVFANLLGNAIKFTPSGGRVTLRSRRDAEDIVFEVADNGPGVSPENQAHLFDRFWQARSADSRGVGLGLAISKGIVEAHGGRIWVLSTPGRGSRFFFALPAIPRA
ncbi:MAG TPA: ATP-binding protein, partial [Gemmatimonadaceae bacterium]